MKNKNRSFTKTIAGLFLILILQFAYITSVYAQYDGINEDIAKHRKGTLIIKAKPGDKVEVEQLQHEFWFGCAISNQFGTGNMSENDRKQYEENFLKNFNSAVTENAVKWGSMEPQKGQVNYAAVDGILNWTEKNHIPLRGHNLFWGVPKFVQPWLKEMNDDELRQTMQHRAETITRKYKGRFAEYDLNNEMVHGKSGRKRLITAVPPHHPAYVLRTKGGFY